VAELDSTFTVMYNVICILAVPLFGKLWSTYMPAGLVNFPVESKYPVFNALI
jgi:hypothetical protein